MNKEINIEDIIKRYIKLRGKTVKEVAYKIGKNEKTLYGILNRKSIDARLLLNLSTILDIDLNWMAELFSQHENISPTEMCQVQRMSEDFRKSELEAVKSILDKCIKENPNSISDTRSDLKKYYPQSFYLLDVLAPPEMQIIISVERGKEKYLCVEPSNSNSAKYKSVPKVRNENEMLNLIIAIRKEEL